ncbi:biotin/lipoyl-binding protein [Candidatus Magnetaquicoccus inordinatus]|uniref:biotin/lipoyl-binding protein n=1 Tax=Candidatus Magnetaquicoccus inordinatus TaxID=2496818 RepID=UPI00187D598B|nr:biotin/lipoyl-binding protein [Candidatus Magnetaquicoccus inordinatus]
MRPLPPLRQDLQLLTRTRGEGGAPAWLLYDRPRHRYFRLGWAETEMLRRWSRVSDGQQLLEGINKECTLTLQDVDLQRFLHFLSVNHLLQPQGESSRQQLLASQQQQLSGWRWLLHHYLFFTIPLLHPDPFLNRLYKQLPWLFRARFLWVIVFLGLLGLYLVSRQWDRFFATLPLLWSWQGAMILGLSIWLAKAVHEWGHALVAKRYGCHIASMGVAFLVMWPVLYIDTTDVWRLPCRRQRLHVAMAGMAAELLLAGLACLLWNLTDDPLWQSGLFTLATVSWVLGLLVNGNPLMRFDGYFLLSDLLDMANLQERSFALGRWQLRRSLLGVADPPPELFPLARQRLLIVFAWSVWIYRFFLFYGIALLVYHTFFKILGLFLFLVEIGWFIVFPLLREARVWWQMRQRLSSGAISRLALLTLALIALLILPWQGQMVLPALWHAHTFTTLYSPTPARIAEIWVQRGERVHAGQPLLSLRSPDLEQQLLINRLEEEHWLFESQRPGIKESDREQRLVAVSRLVAAQSQQQSLLSLQGRLLLRAPFAGVLEMAGEALLPGRWVSREEPLLALHQPEDRVIHAYVDEQHQQQVLAQSSGWFVAHDLTLPRCAVRVESISPAAITVLDWPQLASLHGGPISVRKENERLLPEEALYRLQLRPLAEAGCSLPDAMLVGDLLLNGAKESLFSSFWRRLMAILVRESAF